MSDDERVLRSFVGEDEELRGIWTVTKIERSAGPIPPTGGERSIAVTDERVLWFARELDEVRIADVADLEREHVERQMLPRMVLGGGVLFGLGVVGSIGALIAGVGDLLLVGLPALTGLGLFMATRIIASVTGREGETLAGHRLRFSIDEEQVSIWGDDEARMAAIEEAITGEPDDSAASEGEAPPRETDHGDTAAETDASQD